MKDPNSPTLREGSKNNTLNEISSDDATTANEEVDNDTDENIDDSKEHNKESKHAKTTELDLVKNSTTAIRAASKRRRCSMNIIHHLITWREN